MNIKLTKEIRCHEKFFINECFKISFSTGFYWDVFNLSGVIQMIIRIVQGILRNSEQTRKVWFLSFIENIYGHIIFGIFAFYIDAS